MFEKISNALNNNITENIFIRDALNKDNETDELST
jgi:hypothetical protein